jgi:hypothetical protein
MTGVAGWCAPIAKYFPAMVGETEFDAIGVRTCNPPPARLSKTRDQNPLGRFSTYGAARKTGARIAGAMRTGDAGRVLRTIRARTRHGRNCSRRRPAAIRARPASVRGHVERPP